MYAFETDPRYIKGIRDLVRYSSWRLTIHPPTGSNLCIYIKVDILNPHTHLYQSSAVAIRHEDLRKKDWSVEVLLTKISSHILKEISKMNEDLRIQSIPSPSTTEEDPQGYKIDISSIQSSRIPDLCLDFK